MNACAEPVVGLDLDIVIVSEKIALLKEAVAYSGFSVEESEHSVNLTLAGADLRIQIQKDPRYQDFFHRARIRNVLGYRMRVACVKDVLRGKVWAYADQTRRRSKRQKDLADIYRLVEAHPSLLDLLPGNLRTEFE